MHRGNYDIAIVAELLLAAFARPDDLVRFCRDRPNFRHILEYMPTPLSPKNAVDIVIERCETELLTLELLREVKKHNPAQYDRFEADLFLPSKHGEPKMDIRTQPEGREQPISSPHHTFEQQPPTSVPTSQAVSSRDDIPSFSVLDWLRQVAKEIRKIIQSLSPPPEQADEQPPWDLGRGAIRQFVLLNDRQAVAGTTTGTVLLDLHSQQVIGEIAFVPEHIAVSDDRVLFALANKRQVKLFDVGTQHMQGLPLPINGKLTSMTFSPQKPQLALLYSDDKVELRDTPDWNLVETFRAPTGSRKSFLERKLSGAPHSRGSKLAFDPERQWLASVRHGQVALFEFRSATLTRRIGEGSRELSCIAFSPDGTTVASGDLDGHVRVHQIANGQLVHDFPMGRQERSSVTTLAFSSDGTLLAVAMLDWTEGHRHRDSRQQDREPSRRRRGPRRYLVKLRNFSADKAWTTILCLTDSINSIGFIDSGNVLVSAGSDGAVRFKRLAKPEFES